MQTDFADFAAAPRNPGSPAMDYTTYESPVGPLLLVGERDAIAGLYFHHGKHTPTPAPDWCRANDAPVFAEACQQLDAYFAGQRQQFDLKLAPQGTDFQQRVWQQLRLIPFGETISYGELAKRIGDPKSSRAVGAANGKNPISIIVPCHRVIGADGTLTGFGGGVETKRTLLELEQQHASLFA